MQIIDSAVRFISNNGCMEFKTYVDEMVKNRITHAVVAPSEEYIAVLNQEGNRLIAEFTNKNHGKIFSLAVANPWYGSKALDVLKEAFNQGASGLYIDPGRQGFHLTEYIVDPLIELSMDHNKPIYSYTGTPIFSMPFQLAELARRFPKVRFIMGHAAWSDFWYDVIPAARQAKNIFIDTSFVNGAMLKSIIENLGSDRVVFGTGYPGSIPEYEISKINMLNLSSTVADKIFFKNARFLWGIDQ